MNKKILFRSLILIVIIAIAVVAAYPMLAKYQNKREAESSVQNQPLEEYYPNGEKAMILRGSTSYLATRDRLVDVAPPDMQIDMSLSLKMRNREESDRLLKEQQDPTSPLYRLWLTPKEIGQRFGRTEQEYNVLLDWLKTNGFTIIDTYSSRLYVDFRGTVDQAQKAFLVEINMYRGNDGNIYYLSATDPYIPARYSEMIQGIEGLSNIPLDPLIHKINTKSTVPNNALNPSGITPGDFNVMYNVLPLWHDGFTGKGQAIAIVATSNFNIEDVLLFRRMFLLPPSNPQIIPAPTDPGRLGGKAEDEALVDTEWAGAVAREATIQVVIGSKGDILASVFDSVKHIVEQLSTTRIINISKSVCEAKVPEEDRTLWQNLTHQAAMQGQSIFVPTGDWGADGCNDDNNGGGTNPEVNLLATSADVTAVGGTMLDSNSGEEVVWNECGFRFCGATGGGFSTIIGRPDYQFGINVPGDKRAIPDVALLAGSPGYTIIRGGKEEPVSGTSVSAPCWAGICAILNQYRGGGGQGLANPDIYRLGINQLQGRIPPVFHDVTHGNNGFNKTQGYFARAGYNLCTGWGSVDANAFVRNYGKAAPTISSSLSLSSGPYAVGQTITATFTITNYGSAPITFDILTASGRFIDNGQETCPNNVCPEFTYERNITLAADQSHAYQGTLKLPQAGTYRFFTFYRTPDGQVSFAPATDPGVVNTVDITVNAPFTTIIIDFPGATSTSARGINNAGQIVGWYVKGGASHGFLLQNGSFTTIDVRDPYRGADATYAYGINNAGRIVGWYLYGGGLSDGFLLQNGSFYTIGAEGLSWTRAYGINDVGQIVGAYGGFPAGFIWQNGYIVDELDAPESQATYAFGINNADQIVGAYYDYAQSWHGFLLQNGSFTTIDVPGAVNTVLSGINNAGRIVGYFYNGTSGPTHGFLWNNGAFTTIDIPGSSVTYANGINNAGQIVGSYVKGGASHGFLLANGAH